MLQDRCLLPVYAAVLALIVVPATLGSTVTYQYDELGRDIAVDYDSFVRDTYVYDAANNRTQKQSSYVDTLAPSAPGAISLTNLTQTTRRLAKNEGAQLRTTQRDHAIAGGCGLDAGGAL